MARKNHSSPHKYQRIKLGKEETPVYRCMLPGCLHYVSEEFIQGQMSLCNRCSEPFVITKEMLFPRKVVKPHCSDCNRPTFNRAVGKVMRGKAIRGVEAQLSDQDILELIPKED